MVSFGAKIEGLCERVDLSQVGIIRQPTAGILTKICKIRSGLHLCLSAVLAVRLDPNMLRVTFSFHVCFQ